LDLQIEQGKKTVLSPCKKCAETDKGVWGKPNTGKVCIFNGRRCRGGEKETGEQGVKFEGNRKKRGAGGGGTGGGKGHKDPRGENGGGGGGVFTVEGAGRGNYILTSQTILHGTS